MPGLPATGQVLLKVFFIQVGEDLLDHYRILDAGDDLGGATAFNAPLDIGKPLVSYTAESVTITLSRARAFPFFVTHRLGNSVTRHRRQPGKIQNRLWGFSGLLLSDNFLA